MAKISLPFSCCPEKAIAFFAKFSESFGQIASIYKQIIQKLESETGKSVKGDQIVSLIGEGVVAAFLGGEVVPSEGSEIDVMVDGKRISVKTRKGTGGGWKQTGTIATNNNDAVDYLAFVHLHDDYSLDKIWVFPWDNLLAAGRIRPKKVYNQPRAYIFTLSPGRDSDYLLYPPN